MDFEEIDNLEEEQLNDMYNDVVEYGENLKLTGCKCFYDCDHLPNVYSHDTEYTCRQWCRSIGCRGCSYWTEYNCGYIYCSFSDQRHCCSEFCRN